MPKHTVQRGTAKQPLAQAARFRLAPLSPAVARICSRSKLCRSCLDFSPFVHCQHATQSTLAREFGMSYRPTYLPLGCWAQAWFRETGIAAYPLAARGATCGTKPMRQSRQVQMQIRSPVMHATCSPCCKDAELLPSRLMVPLDSCECAYLRTSQTNDRQEKDQTWDLIADVKRLR